MPKREVLSNMFGMPPNEITMERSNSVCVEVPACKRNVVKIMGVVQTLQDLHPEFCGNIFEEIHWHSEDLIRVAGYVYVRNANRWKS